MNEMIENASWEAKGKIPADIQPIVETVAEPLLVVADKSPRCLVANLFSSGAKFTNRGGILIRAGNIEL